MSWVKTFHVRTDATAQGLARIKELGGVAVVQDPRAAERREMPLAALAATNADLVLPLDEIGLFLRAAGGDARAGSRRRVVDLSRRAE